MKAEELTQSGRLDEALASLQEDVRANPADGRLRVFLFQLLCVMGKWERALNQLPVSASLDANSLMLAQIFQPVIKCEVLRGEVFSGRRTPIIFGEPLNWVGLLVQANSLVAKGQFKAAQELRDKAFDEAPPTPGKLNEKPFEWVADADLRLGPILEVIMEGRYYWIPFCRTKRIYIEPPVDLRDLVWTPAQFMWSNGGESSGHIPTRYPTTDTSTDGQLLLSRKTEWIEHEDGFSTGLGQRILATDAQEYPLLECRTIDLTPPEPA